MKAMPITVLSKMSRMIQFVFVAVFMVVTMGGTAGFVLMLTEPGATSYIGREVDTPYVKPGGDFVLSVKVWRAKSCDSLIRRYIYDSSKREFPYKPEWRAGNSADQRAGVYEMNPVKLKIAPDAAPGPAQFRAVIDWECNAVQRIWPNQVQLPDVGFTILPKDDPQ
jgi:hypothetical protein